MTALRRLIAPALAAALSGCPATVGASGPVGALLPRHGGGPAVDLASRRGTVLVLDVFASWAEGSPLATRALAKVFAAFAAKGVEFYAVAIDADPRFVDSYVRDVAPAYPVLVDAGAGAAESRLGVRVVPTVVVVDRDGKIRARHEGYSPQLAERLTDELFALVGP